MKLVNFTIIIQQTTTGMKKMTFIHFKGLQRETSYKKI